MSDTKLGSALPWNYGIPPEECKGLPLLAWGKDCGFELINGMSLRNAMESGRSPWSKWLDPQAVASERDERAKAEHAYTISAFNYEENPVGSRDWSVYWTAWRKRAGCPD